MYIEEKTINYVVDSQIDETLNDTEHTELLVKLEKAVELLPAEERGLISLFYMENQPIEDIAVVTGLTESNVKVKLHRIRKKLYLIIEKLS